MHDVIIDGRHRAVAATWNELTPELLLRVVRVLYDRSLDEMQQRIHLLAVLLQVPLATVVMRYTPAQIIQIKWLTDFVLADLTLTAQLVPGVTLPRTWRRPLPTAWWGPREKFRNLRFLEFAFADAYFVAYCQDPTQAQWLDNLVAVLYRPQRRPYRPLASDYDGDRREAFNPVHVAARAAQVAHLPHLVKLAIVTWYRGCRLELERVYPAVFTPAIESKAAESTDGWAHVAREMSGPTFGTLEQTEKQLTRDVLAKMEDDARQAEALREQARQNQPSHS
ncbi:MAG: hypothetical protein JWP58_3918 [Hymenobacter sp.]|nr:hypothetical protein [Hymenobacter sp.]